MRLKLYPPCVTHARVVDSKHGQLPEMKLNFYSRVNKAEGLVVQSEAEDGRVLDTVVLAVSPKDGKISASRRLQTIELDIDVETPSDGK